MVNMRQALGVDDFNQMSNYTGQLQNKRRSVGQKDYGLGGKALDMAAALGDAYNQYQPPETALGMMALPAKAVYGLGNMIVQDVGDKTKSIMGTNINNPAAMNQAATDAFGLAADTMAGGGVVSRMTDMPTGAVLGANVFQGGPHKYGPEGASESLKHMSKGEGAQAYGYGRYDAENVDVGQEYATALAQRKLLVDGQENPSQLLKSAMTTQGSPEEYIRQARVGLGHVQKNLNKADKTNTDMGFSEYDLLEMEYKKRVKNIEELEQYVGKDIKFGNQSYLYKHDLPDEDIARYLDYDAPLSEQPESVRKALAMEGVGQDEFIPDTAMPDNFDINNPDTWDTKMLDTGADVSASGDMMYERLVDKYGSKQAASEALAKAGIPGLKYFDGMSRYIDPEDAATKIPILEKYEAAKAAWEAAGSKGLGQEASKFRGAQSRAQQQYPGGAIPTSKSVKELAAKKRTRNFVTWDQDVLNRMKLLERNGESMVDALSGVNNK